MFVHKKVVRPVPWLFAVWQLVWMTVYIPGHTRGQFTLPSAGGDDRALVAPAYCGVPTPRSDHDDAPTEDQKRRCAVCYVIAGYSLPPTYQFDLILTDHALDRLISMREQRRLVEFAFPFFPSGPPVQA